MFQHIPAVTKIAEEFYKDIFKKTSQTLGTEFEVCMQLDNFYLFYSLYFDFIFQETCLTITLIKEKY